MFDMSKSMSFNDSCTFKFPQTEIDDSKVTEDKTAEVNNITQVNTDTVINEDKLNSEQITERRVSQNSDNLMEVQEITPVQTDNDEVNDPNFRFYFTLQGIIYSKKSFIEF